MGIRESVKARSKVPRNLVVDLDSTSGSSQTPGTSSTLQRSDPLPSDGYGSQNFCTQHEERSLFEITLPGITLDDYCAVEDHNEERSEATRFSNPSVAGPSIHVGLGSPIREEPSSYPSPVSQSSHSFENPLDWCESQNFNAQYEEQFSYEDPVYGICGVDELNLTVGEEFEIEYEVDNWYHVKKKCSRRDGKMAVLIPVLYVIQC